MSKFNAQATIKTTNGEGHTAYAMRVKERLVTQVLTTFFNESKFYGDNSSKLLKTARRVAQKDPAFIAKLAVYARKEHNLRSVSHALTAMLAHEVIGKPYIRNLIPAVTVRADDITEIISCYLAMYQKPLPNSIKKGVADKLIDFDEYQLAKYKGSRKTVAMRDAICLCRPKPRDAAQAAMFKRCIEGTLETPYTWETELSANGNNRATWEKLIDSGQVGYMALLRNLCNIVEARPANLEKVLDRVQDMEAVRQSKQLPYRFLSAYKALREAPSASAKVFSALDSALESSLCNLAALPGRTAIAVDVSGSMGFSISNNSEMTCAEVGLLTGVILAQICDDNMFFTFDTKLYPQTVTKGNILAQANGIPVDGGGTDIHLVFEHLIRNKIFVDRVIVLSDNEINCCDSNTVQVFADRYRNEVNPDCWVHAIDLQGYGTQQFVGSKTNIIAGWNEKILKFMPLVENGFGNLVDEIQNYTF